MTHSKVRAFRADDVCKQFAISRATLYRRMKEGTFPLSVSIGGGRGTKRWIVEDIEKYIRNGCVMSLGKPTANVPEVPTLDLVDLDCREISDGKLSVAGSVTPNSDLYRIPGGLESFGLLEYTTSMVSAPRRMKTCLKYQVANTQPTIRYFRTPTGRINLSVRGLRRCELWSCPICARVKAFDLKRRMENRLHALRNAGVNLFNMTFTIKHAKKDKLEIVYSDLIVAWKKFIEHLAYKELRQNNGFKLHFWVREIVYGDTGWHPHIHAIVEIVNISTEIKLKISEAWVEVCGEVSRNVQLERCFHICPMESNSSAYLLKQWLLEVSQKEKLAGGLTPAQLGYSAYLNDNVLHNELYAEYLQF